MKFTLFATIVLLGIQTLVAQDLSEEFKHWYLEGINIRFTEQTSVKVSNLSSFDTEEYSLKFGQHSLIMKQKINDNWSADMGYTYSFIKTNEDDKTTYDRFSISATNKTKIRSFRLTHNVKLEKYSPQQEKFLARAVITQRWKYYNKNLPLKISPYIKNQLYYYLGGSPITYWLDPSEYYTEEAENEDGEIEEELVRSVEQAPNGFHKYRITLGARMKLASNVAFSIFYTRQREFNTGWAEHRELNVPNKSRTRVKRPFNNYSLLGMSITYTIKLY